MSSLHPVTGTPAAVHALLADWAAAEAPPPLTIRTSGSTGEPKDVLLSRSAVHASATATHRRLGGPGQWLLDLPAAYVAGVQVLYRSLLAGSAAVVREQHPTFADAVAAMTGARRYVSVVPTRLARLLGSPADAAALASLDAVLVGGGPLPAAVRAAAEARGVPVVATYGMSETSGGCVYDGHPLDGVAVAVDADGRVRIGGPVLFDGYDGRPDLTAEVLRDGWFRTADLGRLDDDGRLHVLGRADDVVVTGGVNVPAPAVTERLRAHPGVADVEVVGVDDDEWGRRVVAVVVPGDADGTGGAGAPAPSLEVLRDFVAEAHPRSWAPRGLVTVPEIPRLANGKPDRRALEALAAERGGRP